MISEIISGMAITFAVGSFLLVAINIGIIFSFMHANARYKEKQIGYE